MTYAQYRRWLRYHGLFKSLSYLPLPWAYRAADIISRVDRRINKPAYEAIANGLKKAFPDQTSDNRVLKTWLALYFRMMARETMDVFCLRKASRARQPVVLIQDDSLKVLHKAQQEGRGVILAMAHFGRLNMVLFGLAMAGESLGMLTMVTDERNVDLDPVERRYLKYKIQGLLDFIGGPWLTLEDDLRQLYKSLTDGATMVILFDAYVPERSRNKYSLPFMEGTLEVSQGIERLARKTGAKIVYGVAKEKDWHIEVQLHDLPDEPDAALKTAVKILEDDVTETPWQWWHWNILDYIWHSPAAKESK